jgi:hypothetical protein
MKKQVFTVVIESNDGVINYWNSGEVNPEFIKSALFSESKYLPFEINVEVTEESIIILPDK